MLVFQNCIRRTSVFILAVNCTDDPVLVLKNGTDRGFFNWNNVTKHYQTSILYEYVSVDLKYYDDFTECRVPLK